jgi:hypothetical protein
VRDPLHPPIHHRTEYLRFVSRRSTRMKTGSWDVIATRSGGELGKIAWFPRWRQYTFYPAPNTVFNRACLTDIADFIGARMADRRKS